MKAIRHCLAVLGIGFIAEQLYRLLHGVYGLSSDNAGALAGSVVFLGLVAYVVGHEYLGE
jgi:hypothetical protein